MWIFRKAPVRLARLRVDHIEVGGRSEAFS